jgi:hypothetical protein
MVSAIPDFRALLPVLSRNSGFQVYSQIQKVVTVDWTLGLPQVGSVSLQKGLGPPFPGLNVISQMNPQIVGINKSPVPKTGTQETENLDKAIYFDQSVQACAHSS